MTLDNVEFGFDLSTSCPECGDPMRVTQQLDNEGNPTTIRTVEVFVCERCADVRKN